MSESSLARSRALWNRAVLDLSSDEVLAQILDRGSIEDWRSLYRMAAQDPALRRRILEVVKAVPLPFPYFWLAALKSLGERIDFSIVLADYAEAGV